MTLDWTVPVWGVVQLVVLLIAVLRVHVVTHARLTRIEARIDRVERML